MPSGDSPDLVAIFIPDGAFHWSFYLTTYSWSVVFLNSKTYAFSLLGRARDKMSTIPAKTEVNDEMFRRGIFDEERNKAKKKASKKT